MYFLITYIYNRYKDIIADNFVRIFAPIGQMSYDPELCYPFLTIIDF